MAIKKEGEKSFCPYKWIYSKMFYSHKAWNYFKNISKLSCLNDFNFYPIIMGSESLDKGSRKLVF